MSDKTGVLMTFNKRSIYFFIFTLSGFSGLIYESIWTHYLKLFLGHAAYAQTLVLAIFMGGMAIGSWICSSYSGRWKNLLLGYAITEGIIGLCALLFHTAFTHTIELSYVSILPWLGNPTAVTAFKWTISSLMILPQSILLGMTFPLMSSGILRLFPDKPGKTVALLYFSNSIGAAIGVLTSGFILISLVGLPWTMGIAGLINIALALVVWNLIKTSPPIAESFNALPRQTDSTLQNPTWYRLFLLASLVTGTASFIYEIGWIRMLSLVLGASTHAFELMLSAFILGLAFGGLWIQRRIDQVANPVRYLAQVQLFMGLLALSTLLLYGNTFEVMQWIVKTLPKTDGGYALFNLSSSAIAMGIMLPTTFCAGMTLPLITFILIREGHGERSIGAVYAANTVGAIIGVFFAIHLGMPILGLKGLITFGASLDIALGLALLWGSAQASVSKRLPVMVTMACLCAIAGTILFVRLDLFKMGSGVYRQGELTAPGQWELLYSKDGKTATVSNFLAKNGMLSIRTNGKPDASVMMNPGAEPLSDELTMMLLGVIPMTLHPQATTAASIGLGSGMTSHTLLCNPKIQHLDTIEIEKGMIEAANFFRPRVELVYSDPRSRIRNEDAKTFFSTYNKKYDLIVSEPSNPWVSGVAGLFSEEFYRLIKHHMNEDGLFVQWVQLYEINVELVVSVLKAVSANFSDYAVYAAHRGDMMIIARKNGLLPEPDYSVLKVPALAADLHRINVDNGQDIAIRKIGSKKFLANFIASYPIRANSDYYPVLDQNAARSRYLVDSAHVLTNFTHFPVPACEMLDRSMQQRERTNISPNRYYEKTQESFAAMELRDYFQSGEFNASYSPTDLKQKAQLLKQFCAGKTTLNQGERLGIVFNLAVSMTPYLVPSELDSFWKTLESGGCATQITPQERQWYNLFKAVGNRDASRMLDGARTLLAGGGDISPIARKYLLAAGMTGALAQGNKADANQLWTRNRRAVTSGDADLLFRLLAAEAAGPQN